MIPGSKNEAYLNGELIVIKSAHKKSGNIAFTENSLNRLNIVVAVIEDKYESTGKHHYTIYKVDGEFCRTRNSINASNTQRLVKCRDIREHGEQISKLSCDF